MKTILLGALAAGLSLLALAQTDVTVTEPWVRGTVAGQKATGAFMGLKSSADARLVGASSPAAKIVEVHEMAMADGVMRMRAVEGVALPAGKAVELKPGGYHIMLLDLKAPLAKDTAVPLTLTFKDAKGVESKLELKVPVAARAPGNPGAAGMMDGHKH